MNAFHSRGKESSVSYNSGHHALHKRLAWIYDKIYVQIFPYGETFDFVDGVLKKYGCHKVLEVACGTGHLIEIIERNGYDVTGLDISEEMLEITRKRSKWKYVIERNSEKESIYDQARLRAFREVYLKKKLRKHGFYVLKSLHKWGSLILVAQKK